MNGSAENLLGMIRRLMNSLSPGGSTLVFKNGSLVCHGDKITNVILQDIEELLTAAGEKEGRIHLKKDGRIAFRRIDGTLHQRIRNVLVNR